VLAPALSVNEQQLVAAVSVAVAVAVQEPPSVTLIFMVPACKPVKGNKYG